MKHNKLLVLFLLMGFLIVWGWRGGPVYYGDGAVKYNDDHEDRPRETVTVLRVVDGDTIVLTDGRRVRYIGIDAPEKGKDIDVECQALEAMALNRELVDGRQIRLEKDVSETDRYGRLLRHVFINNTLISERLVRAGVAVSKAYPPDLRYQDIFKKAHIEAFSAGLGIYSEACQSKDKGL